MSRVGGQPPGEVVILEQLDGLFTKPFEVSHREEKSGLSLDDGIPRAPGIRGDDGEATGECLEKDNADTLLTRGQHEDARAAVLLQ